MSGTTTPSGATPTSDRTPTSGAAPTSDRTPTSGPAPTSDRTPTSGPAPTSVAEHPSVVRVRERLRALGAGGEVVVLDDHARTAAAAAGQLGVTVGHIANSLVFAVPDEDGPDGYRTLLVLTSGAHRVDTTKVAALIGAPRLDRADADFVRARTGFAIGGVAPVGHTGPVQTLVDDALAAYDRVWAAAGHPRTVFPTSFDELVRITSGQVATVA